MTEEASDDQLVQLVELMNLVSEPTEGFGVVLTVDGATISGQMIPNWQWADEMADTIHRAYVDSDLPIEQEEPWVRPFRQKKERIRKASEEHTAAMLLLDQMSERFQDALVQVDRTGYIHLKNARVFTPGRKGMPGVGMLWRGRLDAVSGWSLGTLGHEEI